MSRALYRKYRSKRLDEIVGQKHVTDVLSAALASGNVAHAYLLTGPRGVGKTSIARILAHEINQLPYEEESTHLDIIEIDAASNNGVDDVRELREKALMVPVSARRKVYIIDEVHMLSKSAFNALLKILEEPPEHVVFILATTDAQKLPATIISRTQQFNFRAITVPDAAKHLRTIAEAEKISIDDEALRLIAIRGDGSFRDSIGLLDQLSALSHKQPVTRAMVESVLGLAPTALLDSLLEASEAKDLPEIVRLLDEGSAGGYGGVVLASQLINRISGLIPKKPHLLPLLDNLLEVARSSRPDVKLLVVLASGAAAKTKTAALQAPPAQVSAPVSRLQKPAASKAVNRADGAALGTPDLAPVPLVKEPVTSELNWQKLIEYTKQHHVAMHSVLSKCSPAFSGGAVVIYTQNAFYKKKLDDAKYRQLLNDTIRATGAGEVHIETIGTPPPLKDSQAAAVAAIMGGGEEVAPV